MISLLLAASLATAGSPLGQKPYGVLILGEGNGGVWKDQLAILQKAFGKTAPWEFAAGEADQKAIQKAVDKLDAQKVRKIIIVPLYLSSNSDLMDQTRFLFGIREWPVTEYIGRGSSLSRRVMSKTPVALAQALDDSPVVVDILAARALALSRKAEQESVFLITPSPRSATAKAQAKQLVDSLAQKVRAKAGFKTGDGALLDDKDLKKKVHAMSRLGGGTLVVTHALSPAETERAVPRALNGVFMRFNPKASLLPDPKLAAWVQQAVASAAMLPDMRQFKDNARQAEPQRKEKR